VRALVLLAAGLVGAAGLASQGGWLAAAGTSLGYGGASALGLAAYLAGWSLGAGWAGARGGPQSAFGWARVAAGWAATPALCLWLLLTLGASELGRSVAAALALGVIAIGAAVQGTALPWLARLDAGRDVAWLWAANLLGACAGVELLAGRATGAHGRLWALSLAGGLAAAAALCASASAGREPVPEPDSPRVPGREARADRPVLSAAQGAWIVGLGAAWMVALEWIGVRHAALWLGSMEPALRASLAAALCGLALGAWILPPLLPRGVRGVLALLALASVAAAWSFVAPAALDALPVGTGGTGGTGDFLRALLLVAPPLVPLGALVPVVQRASEGERGRVLGRLLLHEAWGAAAGIALAHFVLVPRFGTGALASATAALGALAVLPLVRREPVWGSAAALASLATLLATAARPSPAFEAPPYRAPALTVHSRTEDRDFAVAVVDDGLLGERTLLTDGFRAAGTGPDYAYMRVLGHLPLLLHPAPERVAVLALGTGTTLGAVSLHARPRVIDVLEISPAVVAAAPWFEAQNRGVLRPPDPEGGGGDARVAVLLGDGRRTLATASARYDVLTMEPLLPDSPFAVYLYTREFYATARRALRPGGLVCQWVPPHALEPATFEALLAAFQSSFAWSGAWLAGTQLVLVGGEALPALDGARHAGSAALAAELAELGLESPAGLAARFVAPLSEDARAGARALTDADPWIVFRPRRSGLVLLGDLPENLGALLARRTALPAAWEAQLGERGRTRRAAVAQLQAARRAQAVEEARLRGLALQGDELGVPARLAEARRLAPDEPELAQLDAELAFLAALRRGVAELAQGQPAVALLELERARALRPLRGDVLLYLAVARERLGEPDARAALEGALSLCPRIALTAPGLRARELGLSPASWQRLESNARP